MAIPEAWMIASLRSQLHSSAADNRKISTDHSITLFSFGKIIRWGLVLLPWITHEGFLQNAGAVI